MQKRAVFFDRDNTLNIDKGYTHTIDDFVFVSDCMRALWRLEQTDYKKIIITNQSGIGRGYYSEAQYQALTKWIVDVFKKNGVSIDAVYHCPHIPDDGCRCRKPNVGLFLQAASAFDIDLRESWLVGDKQEDIQAGKALSIKSIRIGGMKNDSSECDYRATDLTDAVKYILKSEKHFRR